MAVASLVVPKTHEDWLLRLAPADNCFTVSLFLALRSPPFKVYIMYYVRHHTHIRNHTPHRKPHPGDYFLHYKRGGDLSPGLHKVTQPLSLRRLPSRSPSSPHRGDAAFAYGSYITNTLCVRGNIPFRGLQQHEHGERAHCRRQHLPSFDTCSTTEVHAR